MDLSQLIKLKNKNLILENPDGASLGIIQARDITLSPRFNSIGTIQFTCDRSNCEVYDLITTGRTILLQDVGRYIVENPSETSNGLSDSKTLTCRSFEYDINRKTIPYLNGTYQFYSMNSNDDTIVKRIFSYLPNWTLESVDSSLWNLWRTFDFTDRPLLQAMQEDFSSAFECVFVYNTLDSTIKIISYENVIKSSDIYLSFENLVKTLEITEKTDEIITSLSVFGGNNLSINLVNPLGDTLYDFSYFTDTVINGTKFMSDSLINAINDWEDLVESYQTSYANYLTQRKTKIAERVVLETDLVTLKGELKALILVRDALLESNQSATTATANVNAKQNQINAKELDIEIKQNEIDVIEDNITDIQNEVSIQANFSANQIRELDRFIYHQSVIDENFVAGENDTDDIIQQTAQDLYEKYKRLLAKNKDIKYEFTIDLENFISQSQYRLFTSQLDWGIEVTLKNSRGGLSYPILLGLDIPLDDENADVKFLFSTNMRLRNANEEYNDYLANTVAGTVNKVAGSSLSWGSFVNSGAKDKVSDLFANGLNLDNQEVKSATNQEIIFDSTGLLGRKVVDGIPQQRQWKFINNKLLFTDDNWQTAKLAVGEIHLPNGTLAYGVSGDVIFGKLGKFVTVEANQIFIGDDTLIEYIDNIDFDSDKFVEKDKLYNMTKISTEGGIQVFDINGRERVQIGNYTIGKYGMEIKDKTGSTTVLDESGILQTWQEANVDNVDGDNPLKLYVYLPEYTSVVNKAILRFKREKFRAYSKSIESGGDVVKSSEANDIMVAVTGLATDVDEQTVPTDWGGEPSHYHTFIKTIHHKHNIEIEPHDHTIDIPPHTHGIEYGIYESTMPTNIRVYINGVDYSTYLGATSGYFNTDKSELDITSLLEIGKWNEITLHSSSLGRIDASVFIQAFVQTVRKSIITDKYFVSSSEIGRANSLGRTSSVIIRTDFAQPAQGLYRFSLEGSIGRLYYTDLNTRITSTLPRFEVSNINNLSLAVDGRWIYDEDKNGYLLMTNSEPYMFWVDNSNNLYVKELDSIQEPYLLAENVTYVSSIRAWKNVNLTTADHGILAVYIKTDGLVYYRNYAEQSLNMFSWEEERQIVEFTGTAVRVNLFNTNDYRTGVFIEDSNGNNRYLLTTRNWAGMAIPAEKIQAYPYEIYLDLLDLNYENAYDKDIHIQANPYDIKLDLLFGSTENSILSAENKPIVMLDENEEEYDDWGWIIEFEVQNPIPELLLEKIVVTDVSNSSTILMANIDDLGDNKYRLTASNIIESGFNNVLGDIKIDITGVYNEAGYEYESMTYTFTPVNLVPTNIPVPEVVEVWNE